ncbi:butyrophilin subfamily 3 member A2-like [Nothobranchius furzeri]|uniref:Butyrophilin subfamily 3 member A2-like n=2 Tax=Nothobranchius furzeri TaxID=105023 RepID=A0A9D2Z2V6_NOTFU|nr:butyrophilin subfamily 3 member A2-like [Nothobranchius furzeri]
MKSTQISCFALFTNSFFYHQRKVMSLPLLFVVGVLSFTVYPTAHAEPAVASAGQSVILPCSVKISATDDVPTVEWSKKDLQPDVIFLYRDGCETFEMKNLDFEYRTSLIMREMTNGNVSLRISNVKLSDAGTYRCLKILKNGTREESSVELVVVAASDLKLALLPADTRGVTVECEARCWWPSPQMMIQDENGNNITDEEPREEQTGGCFSVKHRVTLLKHTSRVVCRVFQLMMNQSRTAEIFIPDIWMNDVFRICTYIAAAAALGFMALLAAGFLLQKKCSRSETKTTPYTSNVEFTPERANLLNGSRSLSLDNKENESHIREIADLKSEIRRKEQIICDLKKQISSQQRCPLLQIHQPTMIQNSQSPHQPLDSNQTKPTQTASKPFKLAKSHQKNGSKCGNEKQKNPGFQKYSRKCSNLDLEPLVPPDSPVSDQSATQVHIRSFSEPVSHNTDVLQLKHSSSLPSYQNRSVL